MTTLSSSKCSSIEVKQIKLEESSRIVLDFWSGGPAPIEAKYVGYLVSGLSRESECLCECPDQIIGVIENYAFDIEMIDKTSKEMEADLLKACSEGDFWMFRQILAIDQTIAATARHDETRATSLITACQYGHFELTQQLLQTGSANISAKNYYGMTALHEAAQGGYVHICELLIGNGIDIDSETQYGYTPLLLAIGYGHIDAVKLLLHHQTDANLWSNLG